MKLVLATANEDKVHEIRRILAPLASLELLSRPGHIPEVPEDGPDLVSNAAAKARAISAATGLAALADDTGLFVASLGGLPGVRSSRFAGEGSSYEDNVAALLEALGDSEERAAEFRTVAFLHLPDGRERWVEGVARGAIARQPAGKGGFGYDPIFVPAGLDRTFSQLSMEEKNAISHRGRAFRAMAELFRAVEA